MFEPISANLSLLSSFTVLGFFLAAFYEIIRIIRLFKLQSNLIVGITDFLFLSLAAVVTFAYSIELGNGRFRWFYILGLVFGAAVYFLTVGRVISLASNFIVKCVKRFLAIILKYILVPIWGLIIILSKKTCALLRFFALKIVNVYNFTHKRVINSSKHLKSKVKVLYNKKTARNNKVFQNSINKETITGEKRNVVKGEIRGAFSVKAIGTIRSAGKKA